MTEARQIAEWDKTSAIMVAICNSVAKRGDQIRDICHFNPIRRSKASKPLSDDETGATLISAFVRGGNGQRSSN